MPTITMTTLARAAACAALAAAAVPAHSQSSVNIYGILDTGVEVVTNIGADRSTGFRMPSLTGTIPSRLGFRGAEDLGGGTKAIFVLEQGIAVDQGSLNQSGRAFGRQAYVALTNPGYGTLGVGRQYTQLFLSLIGDTMGPNIYGIGLFDGYLPNARVDNSIYYRGTFGAWTIGSTFSLGRDAVGSIPGGGCAGESAADHKACRDISVGVQYLADTWSLAVSSERMYGGAGAGSPLPSSKQTDTRSSISGYMKFGPSTIGSGVLFRKNEGSATPRSNLYWLGGTYLYDVYQFDAQVAKYDVKNSANDGLLMSARAMYLFSKRTTVYVAAGRMVNSGASTFTIDGGTLSGSTPSPGRAQNGMMVGMRHNF